MGELTRMKHTWSKGYKTGEIVGNHTAISRDKQCVLDIPMYKIQREYGGRLSFMVRKLNTYWISNDNPNWGKRVINTYRTYEKSEEAKKEILDIISNRFNEKVRRLVQSLITTTTYIETTGNSQYVLSIVYLKTLLNDMDYEDVKRFNTLQQAKDYVDKDLLRLNNYEGY